MKPSNRLVFIGSVTFALAGAACGGDAEESRATSGDPPSASSSTGGSGGRGGGGGASSTESPADEAFRMLTGRFDSEDQAASDKSFYAVQLQTCAVAAPELGSRVLYVEQALMTKLSSPYRQRLYVVDDVAGAPGSVESKVFELESPSAAVGLCDKAPDTTFAASEAIAREGCAVRLAWDAANGEFVGGTDGKACESDLNGASYATSKVTLKSDALESLDQGFDSSGMQVWGAVKGPYVFVRRTPLSE